MVEDLFAFAEVDEWLTRLGVAGNMALARVPIIAREERPDILAPEAKGFLAEPERVRYEEFAFPKRRREWLAGRVAAKFAAFRLLSHERKTVARINWQELVVENNSAGKPLLRSFVGPDKELPAISISHSAQLAMGMAWSGKACGVDVQEVSGRIIKLKDRFCLSAETSLLAANSCQATSVEGMLTLLWSAKEAVRKAGLHGLPGFMEIVLRAVVPASHDKMVLEFDLAPASGFGSPTCRVGAWLEGAYALAFTVNH